MECAYHQALCKLWDIILSRAENLGAYASMIKCLVLRRTGKNLLTLHVRYAKVIHVCMQSDVNMPFAFDSRYMDLKQNMPGLGHSIDASSLGSEDLKQLLKTLAIHGAYAMLEPIDAKATKKKLSDAYSKESACFQDLIAKYKNTGKEFEFRNEVKRIHNAWEAKFRVLEEKLRPIRLPIVEKQYSSLEELMVAIDLQSAMQ